MIMQCKVVFNQIWSVSVGNMEIVRKHEISSFIFGRKGVQQKILLLLAVHPLGKRLRRLSVVFDRFWGLSGRELRMCGSGKSCEKRMRSGSQFSDV